MSDVARLAGVSLQTVSRVVNGGTVALGTRDRVLDAIRVLDYKPNSAARALATGRTRTIGLISLDTNHYGPTRTLVAIQQAAHEQEYFTTAVSLGSASPSSIQEGIGRLRLHGVEGILLVGPHLDAVRAMPRIADEIPIVAVGAGPQEGVALVAVDHEAGAIEATRHLLDAGHTTVFHIAGPPDWDETRRRMTGWRSALMAAGATVIPPVSGDWSSRSGYELGRQVLSRQGITAVFAANDQMALGLLRAANEAGRSIPGDLSIVGFDDIPESAYLTPPLTTVRQPFTDLGHRAFEVLINEITDRSQTVDQIVINPELVVRSSTSPPSS